MDKMNIGKDIPWDEIIARLKRTSTPVQETRLEDWLASDSNARVYRELTGLWEGISEQAAYEPDIEKGWHELSARTIGATAKKEAEPRLPAGRPGRLLRWAVAAAAAVCLVAGGHLLSQLAGGSAAEEELRIQQYSTIRGKSEILLSDGTRIFMRNNTTLTLNTGIGNGERVVRLSGEAFFNVAKDEKRRFVVETGDLKVAVHGTEFNVRTTEVSGKTVVGLIEGSVSLNRDGKEFFMVPGEIADCDSAGRITISQGNVELERCWSKDKLVFREKNLHYISHYLSRWYDIRINVDPAIATEYVYTFTLGNEPIEEVMRIMARLNPIEYRFTEDNCLRISKKRGL